MRSYTEKHYENKAVPIKRKTLIICDRVKRLGLLTLPRIQLLCLWPNTVLLLDCSDWSTQATCLPQMPGKQPSTLAPLVNPNSHVSISLGLHESSGNKSHEARGRCHQKNFFFLFFNRATISSAAAPRMKWLNLFAPAGSGKLGSQVMNTELRFTLSCLPAASRLSIGIFMISLQVLLKTPTP